MAFSRWSILHLLSVTLTLYIHGRGITFWEPFSLSRCSLVTDLPRLPLRFCVTNDMKNFKISVCSQTAHDPRLQCLSPLELLLCTLTLSLFLYSPDSLTLCIHLTRSLCLYSADLTGGHHSLTLSVFNWLSHSVCIHLTLSIIYLTLSLYIHLTLSLCIHLTLSLCLY